MCVKLTHAHADLLDIPRKASLNTRDKRDVCPGEETVEDLIAHVRTTVGMLDIVQSATHSEADYSGIAAASEQYEYQDTAHEDADELYFGSLSAG
jgi:hypothetical protein